MDYATVLTKSSSYCAKGIIVSSRFLRASIDIIILKIQLMKPKTKSAPADLSPRPESVVSVSKERAKDRQTLNLSALPMIRCV